LCATKGGAAAAAPAAKGAPLTEFVPAIVLVGPIAASAEFHRLFPVAEGDPLNAQQRGIRGHAQQFGGRRVR